MEREVHVQYAIGKRYYFGERTKQANGPPHPSAVRTMTERAGTTMPRTEA